MTDERKDAERWRTLARLYARDPDAVRSAAVWSGNIESFLAAINAAAQALAALEQESNAGGNLPPA